MKKNLFLATCLVNVALLSSAALASETFIHYQHQYASENHFHSEKFGILHQADNGGWVDITIHLYNKNKDATLDDVVSNAYSLQVGYDYQLFPQITLTPNIEARFYSGGTSGEGTSGDISDTQKAGARYTPGLKLAWQVATPVSLYTQYRYDYRKITRAVAKEDEQNRHRHRIEAGINYQPLDNLTLSCKAYYYQADYILADNKKHDYQHDIDIDWNIFPRLQLNLGAEDVAKSKVNDGREVLLKAGFTYRF
ncbi:oligogalacturonate-specific porin KdgM family protein [Mixta intestinalis]|jgi:predicted porin|uniref:Putative N-acetylneuraminic acid outer membrane channel protein NanC n=1 Tax=Mixta intestinalis TaxID=1615494 RepID=A0A6P1PZH2_9GAMM|nr:oligogalacturonate-specific porin KdgM family protein [Mixta intestinalis]QHM71793.1 putative N-acetylneuraminic acid outer membrane channel protein NanC [Mixta intestinalis]